ncbi:MAG: sugar transferase [Clostridiales bacterium]|nr:sugar transferase [Clostridiales bacterium]
MRSLLPHTDRELVGLDETGRSMPMVQHTNDVNERYCEVWKHIEVRCRELDESEKKPIYDFFKRAFDIVCSFIAIVALSWLLLLTAAAIKLEDGGPAVYSQTRVGKNGKFFKMYKFRSMYVGAEHMKKDLWQHNESDGPTFKMENDPRITKVGAIIRRTSIDELMQLFNILKGDMSIVGPRPPLGYEVMQYDEYSMRRLAVKPGLTCYWQCSGRSSIGFEKWMELDNKYIDERGFWKDIEIILRTIPAVFSNVGAC